MTTLGLLAEPLAVAEVFNRRHPPRSFFALLMDGLRWIGDALLEVAEAMLRPESEANRG